MHANVGTQLSQSAKNNTPTKCHEVSERWMDMWVYAGCVVDRNCQTNPVLRSSWQRARTACPNDPWHQPCIPCIHQINARFGIFVFEAANDVNPHRAPHTVASRGWLADSNTL
jgi:hypothetical protein